MKGTVNILIVLVVLLAVIAGAWEIHLTASIAGLPYASTQEFLNFVGIVLDGILGLILWLINTGRNELCSVLDHWLEHGKSLRVVHRFRGSRVVIVEGPDSKYSSIGALWHSENGSGGEYNRNPAE